MLQYEFFLASSLEKVFPDRRPAPFAGTLSAWAGTRAAVQLVYRAPSCGQSSLAQSYTVAVENAPAVPEISQVRLVPSDFPCWEADRSDDNYLTQDPGLFPDLLAPLPEGRFCPIPRQYRSLWLSFALPADAAPGGYAVRIRLTPDRDIPLGNGEIWREDTGAEPCTLTFTLRVGAARLEPQRLLHTEWFHADCLAAYYHVAPLSEAHWQILERFIQAAGRRHGVNMLLTPVFTPPLDTAVGTERPTVQLVGVTRTAGAYTFDFTALARWTKLCRAAGIEYLEIAHLFTQWGARATPKIMATVDGTFCRLFGWDIPAESPAYRAFLCAFLPALRAELARLGYDQAHVYFHISDEPNPAQQDSYRAAKQQVEDLLAGCPVIDALSSFDFYRQGLVEHPVVAINHIQPFLDAGVPDLWAYYCCAQGRDTPNRFFAMPSARNRIMGVLLYANQIRGFLHWGYNFYFNQYSRGLTDPYAVTHCDYAFPSGDAYLVYPGPDGTPLPSLRAEVQSEALTDLRALQTLEARIGRQAVMALVRENARNTALTFLSYPKDAAYLLDLREAVFDALEAAR